MTFLSHFFNCYVATTGNILGKFSAIFWDNWLQYFEKLAAIFWERKNWLQYFFFTKLAAIILQNWLQYFKRGKNGCNIFHYLSFTWEWLHLRARGEFSTRSARLVGDLNIINMMITIIVIIIIIIIIIIIMIMIMTWGQKSTVLVPSRSPLLRWRRRPSVFPPWALA